MRSEMIIFIIGSVFCCQIIFTQACDKKFCETEKKGCCVQNFGCVVNHTGPATTYEQAKQICKDLGGVLPHYDPLAFKIVKSSCGKDFPYPYDYEFWVQPLPKFECSCVHVAGPDDFEVHDHCDHPAPGIEVLCLINPCDCGCGPE